VRADWEVLSYQGNRSVHPNEIEMVISFKKFYFSCPLAFFHFGHIRHAVNVFQKDVAVSDALIKPFQLASNWVYHTLFAPCNAPHPVCPRNRPPQLIASQHSRVSRRATCFGHKGIAGEEELSGLGPFIECMVECGNVVRDHVEVVTSARRRKQHRDQYFGKSSFHRFVTDSCLIRY